MNILNSYKSVDILVVGDLILDYYNYGTVSRVSPEAPVPVIKIHEEEYRLGGAANVAKNLTALGCIPHICGVLGEDSYGQILLDLLEECGGNSKLTIISKKYKTMVKTRVIGNKQQVARLDFNEDSRPSEEDIEAIKNKIDVALKYCKAVIISDYAKGVCTDSICEYAILSANSKNIPIIVDPKGTNWDKYKNADYITPNFSEYSAIVEEKISNSNLDIERTANEFLRKYQIRNLLLTRSENGLSLVQEKSVKHFEAKAKEVFDVSGAGDTVDSVFTYFLATGNKPEDCAEMANIAGGIVVGKAGTATVSLKELEDIIKEKDNNPITSKIYSIDTLIEVVDNWKKSGETIVVTNGCFDVFHKGHVSSIYDASRFGKYLIVAINSDNSVKRLKGPQRPINLENDRAYVIASLGCVDAVVIFDEDTPETLLSRIKPDVLVKGGQYEVDQIAGRQYAKRVELVNFIEGYSSTNLIGKMNGEE